MQFHAYWGGEMLPNEVFKTMKLAVASSAVSPFNRGNTVLNNQLMLKVLMQIEYHSYFTWTFVL